MMTMKSVMAWTNYYTEFLFHGDGNDDDDDGDDGNNDDDEGDDDTNDDDEGDDDN